MNSYIKKYKYLLILLAILLLSLLLRFYKLGINPPSLDWDEASIGYNAYSILKTGKDEYGNFLPLSFRSFDDYKPPVYIYLTVPSVALFGLNEFAVRFPAAFIGVLAVIVVYFFVRELLIDWDVGSREFIALVSSFFLAVSPWHLQFSRAAFEGNVGMFFLILSLLFFLLGLKRGKFYFLFAISFILSIYSYQSFRLVDPILLVMIVALFWHRLKKQKLLFGISLLIILLSSFNIYLSFVNSQTAGARLSMVSIFSDPKIQSLAAQNVLKAKKEHNVLAQILNNRRLIVIPYIIKGYLSHFGFNFLFMRGDGGVQHHAYDMGMLYLWDLPFIVLGVLFLVKKLNKKIAVLFAVFLLAPLPSALATGAPQPIRAIAMIPAFQIFTATGLLFFILYMSKLKFRMFKIPVKHILLSIAVLLFVYNFAYYLHQYYVVTPIKYGYFWQYGNKQAIEYALKHEKSYNKIIMTYAYDQPYIYYLFYNKINPSWYQTHWDYNGNGEVDRFDRRIGKYEFKNIDYALDNRSPKTLLIGAPSEIPKGASVIDKIYFPDKRVAYEIVSIL